MNIKNRIHRESFEFISRINQKAYNDIFLFSNPVLSKNPFTSKFIEYYRTGRNSFRFKSIIVFFKLCKYYCKSLVVYLMYIIQYVLFQVSRQRYEIQSTGEEFILIDTILLVNKIRLADQFSDLYFPGLKEVLEKKNRDYAYLPIFYGTLNPFRIYRVLRILKKQRVPVLTEFQLLTITDFISLFFFLIAYPIHVISFLSSIKKHSSKKTRILIHATLESLDSVVLLGYYRYLQGKKIALLPYKKIKCISWYENQVVHKNFYKGLREKKAKVTILGAQLFIWPETILNIHPDERECIFGVVPDSILVNGEYYIPPRTQLNYSIGPSLRYKKLFDLWPNEPKKYSILILLPYFNNEIKNVLNILQEIDTSILKNAFVKFHPATHMERYADLLPPDVQVVEKDLYNLLNHTKIIISAATGALVEAVSVGIAAIVIKNKNQSDHNYLANIGKGVIWDFASNKEEVIKLISVFNHTLEHNQKEIRNIVQQYRKLFFCEPSEDKIIEAFAL